MKELGIIYHDDNGNYHFDFKDLEGNEHKLTITASNIPVEALREIRNWISTIPTNRIRAGELFKQHFPEYSGTFEYVSKGVYYEGLDCYNQDYSEGWTIRNNKVIINH